MMIFKIFMYSLAHLVVYILQSYGRRCFFLATGAPYSLGIQLSSVFVILVFEVLNVRPKSVRFERKRPATGRTSTWGEKIRVGERKVFRSIFREPLCKIRECIRVHVGA